MSRHIRESFNVLAGVNGKSIRDALDALSLKGSLTAAKTYVVGANALTYDVPADASVVLFVDEQSAGIAMPASPADNAVVKIVNSNTSAAIAVTGVSNLSSIAAGKEVTIYSGDVGGSGNLWVSVATGTVSA
ncbi:hypothetical protein [Rhodococcus qingshengii]|uniref:hypothetical protein n=1 Tax=Rhodococcus qingshengii TaxID=334542 RepID=UPI002943B940|nr:hypothetical protein [Rhodococcus qingshengii]WOI85990.1 hypothetical protein R0122_22690 [Rhodococcus qingshengii]